MAEAWRQYPGSILLLLSAQDYTAKEFQEYAHASTAWSGLLGGAKVVRRDIADADHTFSSQQLRAQVEHETIAWLQLLDRPWRMIAS